MITMSNDLISRQAAIEAFATATSDGDKVDWCKWVLRQIPSAQPEIIHCRECKHWKQQTNYAGAPLSSGFCESDGVWQSLYGETYEVSYINTDDDFYCRFAEKESEV